MKNIRFFISENFHSLVVKFSVYLKRHVCNGKLRSAIISRSLIKLCRGPILPQTDSETLVRLFIRAAWWDFAIHPYSLTRDFAVRLKADKTAWISRLICRRWALKYIYDDVLSIAGR